MKAAVVTEFGQAPRYLDHPNPQAKRSDQKVVDVLAAGLHPLVRGRASGRHYSSTDALPLVPGTDGVVRDADGRLHYAVLHDARLGSMAEQTLVDADRCIPLPNEVDPILVAAGINPVMSSWVALRRRTTFEPGSRVLVLGATGNAGRLAIQVAKALGAAEVVAAGRNPERLTALGAIGADVTCPLAEVGSAAAEVDVVLDYVWGEPAATAMTDLLTARPDRGVPLTWVEIGAMAGPTAPIPGAALRSSRLQILGSGIGSVPTADFVAEMPAMVEAITSGTFDIRARPMALSDIEQAWAQNTGDDRIVLVP